MVESNRCPKCGNDRPAGAVEGLCPRCLLGAALAPGLPPSAPLDPLARLRPSKAPWSPHERAGESRVQATSHHSVLGTLSDSLGTIPRVVLRETEPIALTPLVRPT